MAGKFNSHQKDTVNRRNYLKTSSLAGAAWACGLRPDASYGFDGPKGGDLEAGLELLNLWDKKPEPVIKLYSAIYQSLASSPDASFAAVAGDETVQALCKEQVHSTLESDLTAIVTVTGLKPGTVTPYRVLVDGKEVAIPAHAAITIPGGDPSEKACITFGTCQHRWGIAHKENTGEILKRGPMAMLMYGDIAVQDRNNNLGMHRADYALRDFQPAWRSLVCSTPVYTSWDDHDYFDNDRWGIPKNHTDKDRRGVRRVWTQAWNNPHYGLGDEGGGIFHHSRIGPCDIIMTDNRYFRTRGGKHCFLGPEQMAWLKKTLLACKGPFIIMSCGTMWSDYVSGGKDSWGMFDREGREEIFSLIEEHKIPGVLLISGDRHGARGFRIPRPSGFEFYEFEPACLGGRTGTPAKNPKWETQLYGFSGKFAFGEFTFDVAGDDPTVTYRLIEATGETLYELTLKRSQLTPS